MPFWRKNKEKTSFIDTRTPWGRARLGMVATSAFIFVFVIVILIRMFDVQILQHEKNAKIAAALHYEDSAEYPERGQILAANGSKLAVTTYVYTVGITPRDFRSIEKSITQDQIIKHVADILSLPEEEVREAAAKEDQTYVVLKKQVERTVYEKLKAYLYENNVGGVSIDTDMQRYYPQPDLCPELIGFSNKRDRNIEGVTGLEDEYNSILAGKPGFSYGEVDNYSKSELYFSQGMSQKATRGYDIVTHIQPYIQKILEEELDNATTVYHNAHGSVGIVMDPKTGAVLAMAQSGSYDPNKPMAKPRGLDPEELENWDPSENEDQVDLLTSKVWLNRAISESYEPGSTYKAFTVATALEEKAVDESEKFSDAPIRVAGWDEYPIKCSIYPMNHGMETMEQGLWNSCNPIMVQVAQRIGVAKFFEYVQAFGHLDYTGIDLPAEAKGLNHSDPNGVDLAVWSFGEQSTVTPIQLINSFCTFGNGGVLMRPQVADYCTDESGRVVKDFQPEVVRRVISEETAQKMLKYLRGVVTKGTADLGDVPGYHVVGKTSTSSHGENDDLVDVSFCSLAPEEDPRLAVLVIMYEPTPATSSQPAQYVQARVMSRALKFLGVKPHYEPQELTKLMDPKQAHDYKGDTLYDAQTNAISNRFKVITNQDGQSKRDDQAKVVYQFPAMKSKISGNGFIYLSTDENATDLGQVTVPDFRGLTVGEAMDLAESNQLNVEFIGGSPGKTVAEQKTEPGKKIKRYSIIKLRFEW